jgi:hypothetical protein
MKHTLGGQNVFAIGLSQIARNGVPFPWIQHSTQSRIEPTRRIHAMPSAGNRTPDHIRSTASLALLNARMPSASIT